VLRSRRRIRRYKVVGIRKVAVAVAVAVKQFHYILHLKPS